MMVKAVSMVFILQQEDLNFIMEAAWDLELSVAGI